MLQELEVSPVRRHRAPLALATVALVVALAAFEVMPILVSAITGCVVMILFGWGTRPGLVRCRRDGDQLL